jgi:hypothetical protein
MEHDNLPMSTREEELELEGEMESKKATFDV